jgi:hypothetical protein
MLATDAPTHFLFYFILSAIKEIFIEKFMTQCYFIIIIFGRWRGLTIRGRPLQHYQPVMFEVVVLTYIIIILTKGWSLKPANARASQALRACQPTLRTRPKCKRFARATTVSTATTATTTYILKSQPVTACNSPFWWVHPSGWKLRNFDYICMSRINIS